MLESIIFVPPALQCLIYLLIATLVALALWDQFCALYGEDLEFILFIEAMGAMTEVYDCGVDPRHL